MACANVKICGFCSKKKKTKLKLIKLAEILDKSPLFGVMLLTIVCSSGEPVAGAVNCHGCDLCGWAVSISYLVHKLTCLHFPNLHDNEKTKETRLNPAISQDLGRMLLVLLEMPWTTKWKCAALVLSVFSLFFFQSQLGQTNSYQHGNDFVLYDCVPRKP